jgi:hypothetical protein
VKIRERVDGGEEVARGLPLVLRGVLEHADLVQEEPAPHVALGSFTLGAKLREHGVRNARVGARSVRRQ